MTVGYVAVSAIVAGSVLRAGLRWSALTGWNWLWFAPSVDDLRSPSVRGWAVLLAAAFSLWCAFRARSHARVAASTAGAAVATYAVMLDVWSARPGPIVDLRDLVTILFARVPLYISTLALVTHAAIVVAAARERSRARRQG